MTRPVRFAPTPGHARQGFRENDMKSRTAMMIAALSAALMTLSACATVKGAGRDITSVGQAGEDAIKR